MKGVFSGVRSFNDMINGWQTSAVTSMHRMFWGATVFNRNVNSWDTRSVVDMFGVFDWAKVRHELPPTFCANGKHVPSLCA